MILHPLSEFAKESVQKFDTKKFRDQLIMALAVSLSVQLLKMGWVKFTEHKARGKR